MRKKYLVVVYPERPEHRDVTMASATWKAHNEPAVTTVTASSPKEAASTAGVAPGGHALVTEFEEMHRFDRAKQAPLEAKNADGSPRATAVAA